MLGNSCVAAQLVVSQEQFSSMELVWHVFINNAQQYAANYNEKKM
jgi:hypothetical protein